MAYINHGPYRDIAAVIDSFLASDRDSIAFQFRDDKSAKAYRHRFHRWRQRLNRQGVSEYDGLKLSLDGSRLIVAYHIDKKTRQPSDFALVDPDSGEKLDLSVDSDPFEESAREFARKLGEE